ncbi:MAG: hemolysin family protein [Lachnospiraceae bacterium]|nr:hemolysin family protein [Lachnospiraceae bacterium]MDD6191910.1 hemolysin family protein [Lachnospiraceae bacterium]MDY4793511.1 hemolysin family protein [Pararoseburia sp.]
MDTASILQFIVLAVLLLLSAFFSSAETALTTVNKIKMKTLADEGDKRAELVLKVTEDSSKMLSAILIGNNIVNLSASSIATALAIRLLGSVGAGIATGVLTLLILIFGEISPKTIATLKATKISLRYAHIIWVIMTVLTPVIFIINFLSMGFLKLLRVDPTNNEGAMTEEELRTLVDVSHESGVIEGEEREYIHNVFDFTDATAKEIMIPRIDMTVVNVNWSYNKLLEVFKEDMFTRLPVYEEDTDNIIGLLNMKDMILAPKDDTFSIRAYLRKVYFTYEQKNTSELFEEMRRERLSLAIVLDEYGAVAGMVTLEDLLEELVGEIRDEFDGDEEDALVQINDREYEVQGSMNLEDLCEELGLGFASEDYDTIGGYLTGLFDHFPEKGEIYVTGEGVILRVDAVVNKRITRVHIKLPAVTEEETE